MGGGRPMKGEMVGDRPITNHSAQFLLNSIPPLTVLAAFHAYLDPGCSYLIQIISTIKQR